MPTTAQGGSASTASCLTIDDRFAFQINDAADAIGLSRTSIYKLIEAGELRAIKIAGRRLIRREDLRALVEKARDP